MPSLGGGERRTSHMTVTLWAEPAGTYVVNGRELVLGGARYGAFFFLFLLPPE